MAGRRRRRGQSRAPRTENPWGTLRVTAVKTKRQPLVASAGARTRTGLRTRERPPARARRPRRCRPPRRFWSRPGCERQRLRCGPRRPASLWCPGTTERSCAGWKSGWAAAKNPSPWSSSGSCWRLAALAAPASSSRRSGLAGDCGAGEGRSPPRA